jgi:hypothetical protein
MIKDKLRTNRVGHLATSINSNRLKTQPQDLKLHPDHQLGNNQSRTNLTETQPRGSRVTTNPTTINHRLV